MCCAILFVFMSFDHRYYNYCFQTQICLIFRVGNACLALMKWNTQLPYWKIFLATYYGRFFILTTLWKSMQQRLTIFKACYYIIIHDYSISTTVYINKSRDKNEVLQKGHMISISTPTWLSTLTAFYCLTVYLGKPWCV